MSQDIAYLKATVLYYMHNRCLQLIRKDNIIVYPTHKLGSDLLSMHGGGHDN